MRSKHLYLIAPLIFFLILGGIYLLYNSTHALGSVYFSNTKDEIIDLGETVIESLGISTKGFAANIELRQDEPLIRQVQTELGLADGNALLREQIPGIYWDLRWLKEGEIFFMPNGSESEQAEQPDSNSWQNVRNIHIRYDAHGRLFFFSREIPDSVLLPVMNQSQARELVLQFIQTHTAYSEENFEEFEMDTLTGRSRVLIHEENRNASQRTDYDFEWHIKHQSTGSKIRLKSSVTGNLINKIEVDYGVPEEYDTETDNIINGILIALFIFSVSILTIVLAFKKSRDYEINFRIAIYLGVILVVLYAIDFFLQLNRTQGWEFIISVVMAPTFTAAIFVFAWAVSESIGRETWKEKLIPLDLLIKGHFMHSRVGQGIIHGLLAGGLTFFVARLLIWACSNVITITATVRNTTTLEYFASFSPVLFLIGHSLWSILFVLAVNFMLIITYLYSRTGSKTLTYILTAIPLALVMGSVTEPIYFGLIFDSVAVLVLIWLFYKSDILAVYFALFTYSLTEVGFLFLNSNHAAFTGSATIVLAVYIALFVFAYLAIFTRDLVQDLSEIEPAISRFISERQRMQQQLEVARQVQMSFLPDTTPHITGLDLAARCLPAYEVGGDYFDFIELDAQRLGVAIGDVSGKGTKAAFYMTLLKGFLRALARSHNSAATILKELNTLFYENATRDAFISMIYGIFDLRSKKLITARSGHNPLLLHRTADNSIDSITSSGLALGLDKGPVFNKKMQEESVPFLSGDIFIFYTDGVTEARNKDGEEFGENRLQETLKKYAERSAREILDGIYNEVRKFKKKADQDDDMTMVVVKVV